jgi:hypothetical protein
MLEGGFTPAPERLPLRANEALEHSAVPALRRLQVEESESEVTISGTVSSYYLKQLAQEALMPILGPRKLFNRVEVQRP